MINECYLSLNIEVKITISILEEKIEVDQSEFFFITRIGPPYGRELEIVKLFYMNIWEVRKKLFYMNLH